MHRYTPIKKAILLGNSFRDVITATGMANTATRTLRNGCHEDLAAEISPDLLVLQQMPRDTTRLFDLHVESANLSDPLRLGRARHPVRQGPHDPRQYDGGADRAQRRLPHIAASLS
ncbi:hypothetical protein [Paludibacterium paludis]|uniref:Uncharacterized protein n=1 Tax=Paludibacterium paludis TaxID=1225769 RepID=A0A918U954_9NEIS|nr:hypothetical protein [Paludibacterium paludis]GGY11804.1 hypothetical protein GCM10011289_13350 [Paludibacterium paludis]